MITHTHRLTKTINRDWSFRYDPSPELNQGYLQPKLANAAWRPIALPHTWSTYETTGDLHPFIRDASESDDPTWWHGWGYYRKTFVVDRAYAGRKLFCEFDGVGKYCRVYLNGDFVGEHAGSFTSFSVDLTDHVVWGSPNVLAVAVSNRRDDPRRIPPMTAGNWDMYGGIYRDARLVITDRLHIPFQGSADSEGGTFVTTPVVSAEMAKVRVRTYVRNERDRAAVVTLRTTILDAADEIVVDMKTMQQVSPGELALFDQLSEPIIEPHLWSPESPYLYQAQTLVIAATEGGISQRVDHWTSPLGFRWFHWDYDQKRLYLNDQPVHIHGTNRHQEYPWLGDAIPKWMHVSDLHDIRFNLGHNFIRGCHYSQDPLFYDLCDRYGILCCEEVPNIKNIRFSDEIQRRHVIEMIRRDRNHPSIIMWSMGNETNCAADGAWARAEDDTRIVHFRHVYGGRGEDEPHNSDQIDMENLLRCTIRGWYNRDVKDAEPSNEALGNAKSGQVAGTEEWQHRMARVEGGSVRGRLDGNIVVWLYADHGADREYRNAPLKHVNPKGWVDAYRVPKYMYYLWQANYGPELMAFVQPHYWRRRYLGQRQDIVVDSNGDSVELLANGVSVGVQSPTVEGFHTVTFAGVEIVEGTITAVARRGDRTTSWSVVMAGEPARLTLSTAQPEIPADRSGIAVVMADIVDARGVHVYGATNPLHWEISGPGALVGPADYASDIDRHEEMEGTMYIDAPVAMPIRAAATPGTITVTVRSPGLEPASLTVRAVAPREEPVPGIVTPPVADGVDGAPSVAPARAARPRPDPAVRGEIPIIYTDLHLGPDSREGYRARLDGLIRVSCPGLDAARPAYAELLDELTALLVRDEGTLIADDYNYGALKHNTSLRG